MSTGSTPATATSTSSGVKNLRAIFETKHTTRSTSPPSRGRSPNQTSASSASSRPVSKVRASFVSVERPDEVGRQQLGRGRTLCLNGAEMQKEQAPVEESQLIVNGVDLGSILKGSAFETGITLHLTGEPQIATTRPEPEFKKQGKESAEISAQEAPTLEPRVNGVQSRVATMLKNIQSKETHTKSQEVKNTMTQVDGVQDARSPAETLQTNKAKLTPTKLSTKQATSSIPKRSPATARMSSVTLTTPTSLASKTKGGPTKIQGVMMSAENAARERALSASKDSQNTNEKKRFKTPSVAVKPTTSSSRRAAEAESAKTQAPTTSKVPRRSLTTKLPSAATAPTAASAARKEVAKETMETDKPKTSERRTTIPHAPRVANTATAASLARKTTRASLAGHEEPQVKPRTSVAPKANREGLLARLTKPTASTASKAHDKVESTSPTRSRNVSDSLSRIPPKKTTRRSLLPTDKTRANGIRHETNEQTSSASVEKQRDQNGGSLQVEHVKARDLTQKEENKKEKEKENAQLDAPPRPNPAKAIEATL